MSRMLKALQRIEARSIEPTPTEAAELAIKPVGPGVSHAALAEPSREPLADNGAMVAAAAARIDGAAAMAAGRAFHKLAEKLLGLVPQDGRATWMFADPSGAEGTAELLIPLGAALAERTAEDVLLVDANLHRPLLSERLGIEPGRGYADVLLGTADWREVIRPTSVPRLGLLPGVRLHDADERAVAHLDAAALLADLGRAYRWVLIGAAPLAHPETARMAAECEGVLLVVRLHRTTQRAVGRAARAIQASGGRLLGSVVLGA